MTAKLSEASPTAATSATPRRRLKSNRRFTGSLFVCGVIGGSAVTSADGPIAASPGAAEAIVSKVVVSKAVASKTSASNK